jgi:hypothetical protein
MNIKTLQKIKNDIYFTQNTILSNYLYAYHLGIEKRIKREIVKKEVIEIIKTLKNLKIRVNLIQDEFGRKIKQYIFFVGGEARFDVWNKKQALKSYKEIQDKIKNLNQFVKKYCKQANQRPKR